MCVRVELEAVALESLVCIPHSNQLTPHKLSTEWNRADAEAPGG